MEEIKDKENPKGALFDDSLKKQDKYPLIFVGIVILIVVSFGFVFFEYNKKTGPLLNETETLCIANHSTLYVQAGCTHCKEQESIFGDNFKYLTPLDCLKVLDTCTREEITVTPTWIVNGTKYEGVQSAAVLKEVTGC